MRLRDEGLSQLISDQLGITNIEFNIFSGQILESLRSTLKTVKSRIYSALILKGLARQRLRRVSNMESFQRDLVWPSSHANINFLNDDFT